MAKSTAENLKLGIFVVLGTALLLLAAFFIGNRQNMFSQTFSISATFRNVSGLQKGNNVRFSGINVGTVNGIDMINNTTIRVRMIIDKTIQRHIKLDAIALIGSDGLVGSMLVNIVPGEGDAPLVQEGDELESGSKVETQEMLNTLSGTNENAALLMTDLLKVTRSIISGKGTIGLLLNDTTLASDLRQTIGNLDQAIVNLTAASNKANSTLAGLNSVVDQLDLEQSAAGVLLSDTIAAGKVRNVIGNLEDSSVEIAQITKDLNAVIVGMKEGSLVNYVSEDTTLVRQLETTMQSIEQGTERFNENMEALKHNFLTRGYFRKLERKARKEARE